MLVSRSPLQKLPYEEDVLRENAFTTAGPVRVRVTSPGAAPPTAIAIERLNSVPINRAQTTSLPSTFDVEGGSRGLNGQRIWLAARCAPDERWFVLSHTMAQEDGNWRMDGVSLPAPRSSAARRCQLHAVNAADDPPTQAIDGRQLSAWVTVRSGVVDVARHPYHLAFASFTDSVGRVRSHVWSGSPETLARLNATIRSAEVESEPLPEGIRIWQALRCEGCSSWVLFGPAQSVGSNRHLLTAWQSGYPARPSVRRFRAMAIAARESLEGAALTQTELEAIALGTSRTLMVDNPASRATPHGSVQIERPEISTGGDAGSRATAGDVLDVTCVAELPSERLSVYVGYLDPGSARWFFHRGARTGDRYRVTTSLYEDHASGHGGRTLLVPVLAESLPVGRGLSREWWSEMVIATGDAVRFDLPSRPWWVDFWYRLTGRPFPSPVGNVSGVRSEEANVSTVLPVAWLVVLAIVVTAILASLLWKRATLFRAVWNGVLDGRRRRDAPRAGDAPFTDLLKAMTEANVVRTRRKAAQRLAPIRERLAALEQRLHEVYLPEFERLKQQTGRHDASTPLSPTAHHLLLLALTVGESSFNLAVFYVFREPAVYTLLMALAVAIAIPICAFSVGLWIRRWQRPWLGPALKLGTTMTLLASALVGLNRVRMAHLASVAPDFVQDHPDLNTAFLSFNALIFVASVMVTYWGHDVEENFAEAKHKVERLNTRISKTRGEVKAAESDLEHAVAIERERGRYYLAAYNTSLDRRRPRHDRTTELGMSM